MQSVRRLLVSSSTKNWRTITKCAPAAQSVEPQQAPVETLTAPPPSNVEKPVSPKIEKLATEISQLNLIEGGFAPAPAADEEEEATPQKVKSAFTVKLMKFDEKQKVALIKEVKNLLEGMNLVQAKKFVESAPTVVKADIAKEEADKLKEAIEKVGGTVLVE
ncbi:hypothetical protein NQ318_022491 [Aromia moschata]|uniref:Large ribosomal subunit protein bL12 C-terminal domain-containing protein n=1 Tax=Aromia moschata TaxID=1265417 RepID=A0AAV8Z6X0_9CUCU|nr:hypothetical protein NQ318_022491 [Aromia moschata]